MQRMNHPLFEAVDEGWSRAEPSHICPSDVLGTYVSDINGTRTIISTQLTKKRLILSSN
jgi:hypothetical protein